MLALDVRHRLGDFRLEAALDVPPASVLVLVGENGSGKSTLLRIVAGLIEPDDGRVTIGTRRVSDRATGLFVPARDRGVGYVAQDYALFPHLSVRDNVGFGLGPAHGSRAARRARLDEALTRFDLRDLAGRRPSQLSGGQQQRVALARALVLEPLVLLLDEPLAALDLQTRRAVRGELRRLLAGLPCATLFVTHQPTEALVFGERIAVLEEGRVTQCGPRLEFLLHPRSTYAAEFLGVNLLEGDIVGPADGGLARVQVEGGTITVPHPGRPGRVRLLLHPREITLSREAPGGSARNVLRGAVEELIPEPPDGERVRVLLSTRPPLTAEITRESSELLGLSPGAAVHASFKATGVNVLPS